MSFATSYLELRDDRARDNVHPMASGNLVSGTTTDNAAAADSRIAQLLARLRQYLDTMETTHGQRQNNLSAGQGYKQPPPIPRSGQTRPDVNTLQAMGYFGGDDDSPMSLAEKNAVLALVEQMRQEAANRGLRFDPPDMRELLAKLLRYVREGQLVRMSRGGYSGYEAPITIHERDLFIAWCEQQRLACARNGREFIAPRCEDVVRFWRQRSGSGVDSPMVRI
jgi:hypothetical protein